MLWKVSRMIRETTWRWGHALSPLRTAKMQDWPDMELMSLAHKKPEWTPKHCCWWWRAHSPPALSDTLNTHLCSTAPPPGLHWDSQQPGRAGWVAQVAEGNEGREEWEKEGQREVSRAGERGEAHTCAALTFGKCRFLTGTVTTTTPTPMTTQGQQWPIRFSFVNDTKPRQGA